MEEQSLPLIGDQAPAFTAQTTHGEVNFPDDYQGKWVILFSHPADFTPVCTTEFMTFASMADRFQELNCELLGLSIDSNYSHIAWVRTIEEKIEYKDMKQVIGFDHRRPDMEVAQVGWCTQGRAALRPCVRLIIDPEGRGAGDPLHPQSNGRNMDEICGW